MNNIARIPSSALGSELNNSALALIRRTVAADTTDDEFNLFISYCTSLKLDPRRRQIYALVYNKNNPQKRKMSIIVAIDGFRSIAARSGCYRPDEDEPRFEIDPEQKGPANPLGLVKAVVKVWQFAHGDWHPVSAVAYWDEYAPVKEEWAQGEDGQRRPTGKREPDGKWKTMPRLMLSKVAEALALRKAWPDDFSGVYAEEEVDRSKVVELSASEAAAAGATQERMERIGGGHRILIDWLDNRPLDAVPVGSLADRIFAFIKDHAEEPSQILFFQERNRVGLKEFWAQSPGDALEVKKALEVAVNKVATP